LIWPDLYQTLRASCETEWASKFPQHAVSAWIGHSVDVSAKHYLRITDHLLDMASDKSATKSAAVKRGTGSQEVADGNLDKTDPKDEKGRKPHDCEDLRPIAISREVVGGGIEPPTHGFSDGLRGGLMPMNNAGTSPPTPAYDTLRRVFRFANSQRWMWLAT
jgi:hypothetical protein